MTMRTALLDGYPKHRLLLDKMIAWAKFYQSQKAQWKLADAQ